MSDDSYLLSKQAVERTATAVRRIEDIAPDGSVVRSGRQAGYRKLWYRIISNDGSGAYTLRRQVWDSTASQLVDLTDTDDIEYNVDVTGYDCLGQDSGAADQRVPGWKVHVNDEWVTLIDVVTTAKIACRVTASTPVTIADNLQWRYTVVQVRRRRLDSGVIETADVSGGFSSSQVYNKAEIINPAASGSTKPHGNMLYPDQLTEQGSFAIVAVPVDTYVEVSPGTLDSDTSGSGTTTSAVYWFKQANPAAGGCDT